ncbi:YicC family protein [Pseudovibrio exalbescens]|uniref:YicC/YloC family endoribonuclease n=1 Tax=Pseudovibrio exalbescens TaxID=197461 RepID=UPI00236671AE|nr:YicC/YloC family endoribonuclease [Pseudovibrio exalbescens]MDD7908909.1 YicC family protein [Pseudovibrio exalbescens]
MTLASMTGFSREEGTLDNIRWTWELRSVNGKGLDMRLRIPQGYDALEATVRGLASKRLKRGNVSINLQVQREQNTTTLAVNEQALEQVLQALAVLQRRLPDAAAPNLDGILAHKGVLELQEAEETEDQKAAILKALEDSFKIALDNLVVMREREGESLNELLSGQAAEILRLTEEAEGLPSRQADAIKERIAAQVAQLMEANNTLEPQRLHQEAVLLATKADIREELDRLYAHVNALRDLISTGGAVGRRMDFLAQEFNREANTLCSKSNSVELTAIGLQLKTVIDQMREQIQNVE